MKKKGFFAHPSHTGISYTINRAVNMINSSGYDVEVVSWSNTQPFAEEILTHVCDEILEADVFLCDLTQINLNVLFELGYALVNNRQIWISVDTSRRNNEHFEKEMGGLLTTFAYAAYANGDELGSKFLAVAPFDDSYKTPYKKYIEPITLTDLGEPSIFYLKSVVSTDASNDLTRLLQKSGFPLVTDNAQEVSTRMLDWYIENVYRSVGVIAHFLDDDRGDKYAQNAKYAFVCGMAYGTAKPLQMLAHEPYKAAIDFKDLMFVHSTPEECIKVTGEWLKSEVKPRYESESRKTRSRTQKMQASLELRRVNIGQYVAEDEELYLKDYFVRTSYFDDALKTEKYHLFVGRKGTGKTANLYQIAQELRFSRSQYNHVCVIKPLDYDLEGIFRLFQTSSGKSEQSYLVESLWKFLIFTELALSLYEVIQERPEPTWTVDEQEFITFVNRHQHLVRPDFTLRMEQAIETLCQVDTAKRTSNQKQKVSEILHDQLLSELRRLLGKVLQDRDKVFVLIDNLDKTWEKRHDLRALSHFLFGLLNIGQRVPKEFHHSDSRTAKVNLSLIIFLRSDIYAEILPQARERDRLRASIIDWNDREILQLVIERRFAKSLPHAVPEEKIWEKFFCNTVEGKPTKQYLVDHVMPRPRDIILLCKQALTHAINRGHTCIDSDDILDAQKDYSKYCWFSLLAETEVQFQDIEALLTEFAGSPEIVTREQIAEYMEDGIIPKQKLRQVIELLCDVTFLGLEVSPNQFEFIYDESRKTIIQSMARKTAKSTDFERYMINIPFHSWLGIKSQNISQQMD